MTKEMICICCPKGCHLKIDLQSLVVSGNSCPKGDMYAKTEITNPTRIITSTIKVIGGNLPLVSVKTDKAIDKKLIFKAMKIINKVKVKAPVNIGDILIENILDSGVNIIATKDVQGK